MSLCNLSTNYAFFFRNTIFKNRERRMIASLNKKGEFKLPISHQYTSSFSKIIKSWVRTKLFSSVDSRVQVESGLSSLDSLWFLLDSDSDSGPIDSDSHLIVSDLADSDSLMDSRDRIHSNTGFCLFLRLAYVSTFPHFFSFNMCTWHVSTSMSCMRSPRSVVFKWQRFKTNKQKMKF